MTKPFTGGCACGAIRYSIASEPLFSNHCQCRDCQRESGSGHGSYVTFARAGVTLTGEATHWDMGANSGKVTTRGFRTSLRSAPQASTSPPATSRRRSLSPRADMTGIVLTRTCRNSLACRRGKASQVEARARPRAFTSTMKLQPINDLVDHLALGAHRKSNEVEVRARHCPPRLAIGGIMRGLEHVLGVDRRLDAARQGPIERARQCGTVGAVDQDRLSDQRVIFRARRVLIGLADAVGKRSRDAAGQERGNVELLPGLKISADHN